MASRRFTTICALTIGQTFLAGCRTLENSGYATWKHTFGETRAERATRPDSCTEGTQNPDEHRYIRMLVDHIIANNPKTFTGDIAPSSICVTVSNDPAFNARMNPSNGSMIINKGLLNGEYRFSNDAQVAGIIAHELAHFTMAHGINDATRVDNIPPGYSIRKEEQLRKTMHEKQRERDLYERKLELEFLRNAKIDIANITEEAIQKFKPHTTYDTQFLPGIKRAKNAVRQVTEADAKPAITEIEDAMLDFDQFFYDTVTRAKNRQKGLLTQTSLARAEAILTEREAIRDKVTVMDPPIDRAYDDLLAYRLPRDQFDEQQADEVGLELYIRAGFEPDVYGQNFANIYEHVIKKGNCDWVTARSKAPNRLRRDKDDREHPDFCFRYWDLKYVEQRVHKEEYQAIARRPGILNLEETAALRRKIGMAP